MVLRHAVNNLLRHAVFPQKLDAQIDVAALAVHDNLADVVEQTPQPHDVNVRTHFLRECYADFRFLKRVRNHILTVGKTVFETSQMRDDGGRQIIDAHGMTEFLTLFKHDPFDFLFNL